MMSYSENERLKILRIADNWRQWTSLDDERLCIECTRLITGHEIVLAQQEDGKASAHCPTPGCKGEPRDWFYHGARNHPPLANIVQLA